MSNLFMFNLIPIISIYICSPCSLYFNCLYFSAYFIICDIACFIFFCLQLKLTFRFLLMNGLSYVLVSRHPLSFSNSLCHLHFKTLLIRRLCFTHSCYTYAFPVPILPFIACKYILSSLLTVFHFTLGIIHRFI